MLGAFVKAMAALIGLTASLVPLAYEFTRTGCFSRVEYPRGGRPGGAAVVVLEASSMLEGHPLPRDHPALIKGALSGLPALRWDVSHMARRFGHYVTPSGATVREVARAIESDPEHAPYWSHDEEFGEAESEEIETAMGGFSLLAAAGHAGDREAVVWMGGSATVTPLHFDDDPLAVLFQLSGRKRVLLIPPEFSRDVDPLDRCSGESATVFSAVPHWAIEAAFCAGKEGGGSDDNDENNDNDSARHEKGKGAAERRRGKALRRYPRLANVTDFACVTLDAGEALFIPSGWWHAVTSSAPGVSISVRTLTRCQEISLLPYEIVADLVEGGYLPREWRTWCIRPFVPFHEWVTGTVLPHLAALPFVSSGGSKEKKNNPTTLNQRRKIDASK